MYAGESYGEQRWKDIRLVRWGTGEGILDEMGFAIKDEIPRSEATSMCRNHEEMMAVEMHNEDMEPEDKPLF
jgi:hypothetical protein